MRESDLAPQAGRGKKGAQTKRVFLFRPGLAHTTRLPSRI